MESMEALLGTVVRRRRKAYSITNLEKTFCIRRGRKKMGRWITFKWRGSKKLVFFFFHASVVSQTHSFYGWTDKDACVWGKSLFPPHPQFGSSFTCFCIYYPFDNAKSSNVRQHFSHQLLPFAIGLSLESFQTIPTNIKYSKQNLKKKN